MLLADWLIWALENDDIGGIKIYCEDSIKQNVAKTFRDIFETEWKNALEKVEAEYGNLDDKGFLPVFTKYREYGILVSVGALDIKYCWGEFCDLQYGREALDNALKATKEQYPTIEYDGLIAYPWSDRRGGDVVQYEVSSKKEKCNNDTVYDFVGEAIAEHLAGNHLWERQDDPEVDDLTFAVTGKLHHFENQEEISEYIEDLGAAVSGSVSKKTSYLINNDPNSSSAKNKKAKELGIPIITEDEFICRFGDPDEYNIDYEEDDFWRVLSEQLCDGDEETFSEIAETLYAYLKWIGTENMERAFNSMIDMLSECDTEIRDNLKEIAKRVLAGEYFIN